MKIIFQNQLETDDKGHYASFTGQRHDTLNCIFCDIKPFVEKHQTQYLKEIDQWHEELTEKLSVKSKYWWCLPGSRLMVWNPEVFDPHLFSIGVINYCKLNNVQEIKLLDCPDEVRALFEQMNVDKKFDIKCESPLPKIFDTSSFKRFFKIQIGFICHFMKSMKNLFRPKIVFENKTTVFYSHLIENAAGNDHFFGNLVKNNELTNTDQNLWVYFEQNLDKSSRAHCEEQLKLDKKSYLFVHEVIMPIDIIKSLICYYCIVLKFLNLRATLPILNIGGIADSNFSWSYFISKDFCYFPIYEFQIYHCLKRILNHNVMTQRLIYPYEEKGLERAMLMASRNANPNIISIGYAHSIHNEYHRYFKRRTNALVNPPRPDIVAVTGPAEKYWLIENAHVDQKHIQVVGSSRYLDSIEASQYWVKKGVKLRVLFTVCYSFELEALANFCQQEPELFSECDFVIRTYPFSWVDEQERGLGRLNSANLQFRNDHTTSLEKQLEWSDVVLFNGTSVGIVAMLKGRIAVYANLCRFLRADPISNKGDDRFIIKCETATSLKDAFKELSNMSIDEYNHLRTGQREFALKIYSPPDQEKVSQLFEEL